MRNEVDGVVQAASTDGNSSENDNTSVGGLGSPAQVSVESVQAAVLETSIRDVLERSEQRYRRLIANLPDVTWTAVKDGSTVYISENVASIYGYTAKEVCSGGPALWFGRIHSEDVGPVRDAYNELFSHDKPFDSEYRIQHKNGKWMWIHDRALRTYEEGGVRYADGVFSDISGRKRAEQALLESERRHRFLFEHNLAGVFRASAHGKLLDCNPALIKMLGYGSREELLQHTTADILFDPSEERDLLIRMARESVLFNEEIRLRHKDGKLIWALHNVGLIKGTNGEPDVVEGTVFDISRRRQAEQIIWSSCSSSTRPGRSKPTRTPR